ncbi:MAG: hypothetical protein M1570_02855 [Chloroflexi bacterium]|nr:hypothetical protein [Chloroflexota bacterium]
MSFKHHRRSIRLRGYDYSREGAYFVTICTQNRKCLFGEIVNGEMQLNDPGAMIVRWWDELSCKFPTFEPDAFVVMPNHIHSVMVITCGGDQGTSGIEGHKVSNPQGLSQTVATPDLSKPATLGDIADWFKTMVTNEYTRGVKQLGWQPYFKKVLQRNYYEHIIRNERELRAIRQYIRDNPANWDHDMDNLENDRQLPPSRIVDDYLREIGIL